MSFWSCSGLHSVTFGSGTAGVLMCVEHQRNDGNHKDSIAIRVRVADSIALISIKLCFFFLI